MSIQIPFDIKEEKKKILKKVEDWEKLLKLIKKTYPVIGTDNYIYSSNCDFISIYHGKRISQIEEGVIRQWTRDLFGQNLKYYPESEQTTFGSITIDGINLYINALNIPKTCKIVLEDITRTNLVCELKS